LIDTKTTTVRSERKPRHAWFDYEVLDVFGDQLGPFGITVYMVLARLCYGGYRVKMGQRELAQHARMSKTELRRTLARMIELGLVVETEGPTPKSRSSYDLMDVKDLVEEILASAKARGENAQTGPHRTRSSNGSATGTQDAPRALPLTNHHAQNGDAPKTTQAATDGIVELEASDVVPQRDTNWSPQDQMLNGGKKPESGTRSGPPRDQIWSSTGPDLVQSASRTNRQETRNKKQEQTPPPPLPAVAVVPVVVAEWAKTVLAIMAPLGVVDARTPKRILADARKANPAVSLEEISFWIGWLRDKAQQPGSSVRDPGAYVIRMLGECVAGGQYAQLKAGSDERRDRARDQERQRATLAWEAYQPVAPAHAATAWRAVTEVLEKQVIRQAYETWIKPTRGLDAIDGKLYVQVPSREFQYIGDKYGDLIHEAIEQQRLKIAEVLFVASPEELPWSGPEGESP
jgi:DNA-binding HxlR family transcriptional regulator